MLTATSDKWFEAQNKLKVVLGIGRIDISKSKAVAYYRQS